MLWMNLPADQPECGIALYRCKITVQQATDLKYEASADEFCRLYLDGELFARGPERGSAHYWFKISGELHLAPGEHTLTAEVFAFGAKLTAWAQESVKHGFFWHDDQNVFSDWQCRKLENIDFIEPYPDWGAYPKVRVAPTFKMAPQADDSKWEKVACFEDGRILHERMLPEMRFEKYGQWQKNGGLITFDHYVCAYGDYTFEGKGSVKLRWSETPFMTDEYNEFWYNGDKGCRNGTFFVGNWDEFEVDGSLHWQDFHFKAGRFLEIVTEGEVKISSIAFYKTGYPWQFKKLPALGSAKADRFGQMVLRTLENCTWETFMDCPFFEQLMYVGDSRISALISYMVSDDKRPVEKALRFFAMGLQDNGMIYSHTPAKQEQMIPSFSLIYILMLKDYGDFGGNAALIKELLPVARRIMEAFPPENGWFFLDWVPEWDNGVPHGDCAIKWLHCHILENMCDLESRYGDAGAAAKYDKQAQDICDELCRNKWVESAAMFSDKNTRYDFNEHAQILALLCDHLPEEICQKLLDRMQNFYFIEHAGAGFSFYYLQAMYKHRQKKLFDRRMQKFLEFEDQGLDTTPENFGDTRSDCHVWSGHPLYFMLRNIAEQRF